LILGVNKKFLIHVCDCILNDKWIDSAVQMIANSLVFP